MTKRINTSIPALRLGTFLPSHPLRFPTLLIKVLSILLLLSVDLMSPSFPSMAPQHTFRLQDKRSGWVGEFSKDIEVDEVNGGVQIGAMAMILFE